ncbi:hypothetical protein RO3G_09568 [Rhizopus delemar RA 99-880]|uniref:Uncharacterized protein n=1 Tax=Rhizopus delemar (strain RA 99-880 / ATCC MYA-4621 / FGSC 9543 / NRRL 43880) TaxID=246409 RepID=I1C8S8_RHIO9|nr:hypothetical protein RO3G_09568 [Rhizopus delemar RA 99-880]|eukprot:EIE84858.1 hypothetical protein RO3G_09568 [Rhizopus delemar RA 99-880]
MNKCRVDTFLLELSDGTAANDQKIGDGLIKLSGSSVHVLNAISNHLYNRFTLHTYRCHYSNKTISFELLTLVDNSTWCNDVLQLACQLEKVAADESTLSSIFLHTGSPPSN